MIDGKDTLDGCDDFCASDENQKRQRRAVENICMAAVIERTNHSSKIMMMGKTFEFFLFTPVLL